MTTLNDEITRVMGEGTFDQDAYLSAAGYPPSGGTLEDRWLALLTAAGYTTGTLNDRWLRYWSDQP